MARFFNHLSRLPLTSRSVSHTYSHTHVQINLKRITNSHRILFVIGHANQSNRIDAHTSWDQTKRGKHNASGERERENKKEQSEQVREQRVMDWVGGFHEVEGAQNSVKINSLARFAVEEHNKKQNALLEFKRVISAKQQVVAGILYHITLEATVGEHKKVYEAKVCEKSWLNFKKVQEFKESSAN